jgi:signal transduction histidine kinase
MGALRIEIETTQARIVTASMPTVRGDQMQLSLVFQNLISNSIKYAKDGVAPLIQISAEQSDGERIIRVQDNGIGFEQKYAERVFDLFQRLGGKNVPGTGLGLAICRRIIERHGGRIWADSQPGTGSTFHFTLPTV